MFPALRDGDILVTRAFFELAIGDIVIVEAVHFGCIVKRISGREGESVILKGDNPRLDSSFCGVPIPAERVVGKLIFSVRLLSWSFLKALFVDLFGRLKVWK